MSDVWGEAARNVELVVRASWDDSERALAVIGTEVTNEVKVLVTGPSPSEPGQPPGLVTGGLRLSYKWEPRVTRGRYREVWIGSDKSVLQPTTGRQVDYAPYLEFGTRRMAPRPHFRPAVLAARDRMPRQFARVIENAQRRQARQIRARSDPT